MKKTWTRNVWRCQGSCKRRVTTWDKRKRKYCHAEGCDSHKPSGKSDSLKRVVSRLGELMERARRQPEYFAEGARLDFTEAMCARLATLGMSHYKLHKLSGISKGQISKTFRHAPNLTIETMTKLAMAVGMEVKISLSPIPANEKLTNRPSK